MPETWTVKRVLDWTVGYLQRKGDERPRLSAEWLLCYVTGLSRVEVYTNFDRPLTADELDAMHEAVARRGRGEPLQYVTGEMPFRHIVMRCEQGVLIPRPETEILVDAALVGVDAALSAGVAFDDVRRRTAARTRSASKPSASIRRRQRGQKQVKKASGPSVEANDAKRAPSTNRPRAVSERRMPASAASRRACASASSLGQPEPNQRAAMPSASTARCVGSAKSSPQLKAP